MNTTKKNTIIDYIYSNKKLIIILFVILIGFFIFSDNNISNKAIVQQGGLLNEKMITEILETSDILSKF